MANFTTEQKVRDESGFTNNPNVTTSSINGYVDRANGIILSYVGARYLITKLVSGTDFDGSQTQKFLIGIETRLAAAYLLQKEYGTDSLDTDKDGYRKENECEYDLEKIMKGEIRLLKKDGSEFERAAERKDPTKGVIGTGLAGKTGNRFFSVDQEF